MRWVLVEIVEAEVLRASPVKTTGVPIPDLVGCAQNDNPGIFRNLVDQWEWPDVLAFEQPSAAQKFSAQEFLKAHCSV